MPTRVTLILCVLLAACATQQNPQLDASIEKELSAGIPSIAVAVAKDGRIVHEAAFGFADAGRPATVDTPYPLASVTKPFVAAAVLQLAARGVVDLDQPAHRYAGGWIPTTDHYTLRQLLNHTSGLPTYATIYWNNEPPRSLESMFARYGFTAHPPGTVSEYSNLGYGLLGHILEVQTGQKLDAVLQGEVLRPLGLRHTMLVDSAATPPGAAHKYDAAGKPLPDTYNDTPAAGNLYASVHDLVRFGMHQLAHPTYEYVDRGALYPYYDSSYYGLGWYFRTTKKGTRVVWHEGGMPGASSIIVLLPDQHIAAAAVINSNDHNDAAQSIVNQLIASVDPTVETLTFVPTDGFAPYDAQPTYLGSWEGTVTVDGKPLPCTMTFNPEGKITVKLDGRESKFGALANGDLLLGTFVGTLDGQNPDSYVLLRLVRHGEQLNGTMISYAAPEGLRYLHPVPVTMRRAVSR